MKRIDINFAPNSLRQIVAQTGSLTWIGSIAAFALCLAAVVNAWPLMKQLQAAQTEVERARAVAAKPSRYTLTTGKVSISAAQADAVNGAIAQLNLPWRDLLDSIEASTPSAIALLALDPNAQKGSVRGIAEAKTPDEMLAYIEQLKRQQFFETVILTKHEINEQDTNRPIRFHFEARWVGGPR